MPATITRAVGEAMRDAAANVRGVAGLSSGRFGEVALLLPGTRINGIRPAQSHEGVEVHLIYDAGSNRPIPEVANDARAAVNAAARSAGEEFAAVDIIVADAMKEKES